LNLNHKIILFLVQKLLAILIRVTYKSRYPLWYLVITVCNCYLYSAVDKSLKDSMLLISIGVYIMNMQIYACVVSLPSISSGQTCHILYLDNFVTHKNKAGLEDSLNYICSCHYWSGLVDKCCYAQGNDLESEPCICC